MGVRRLQVGKGGGKSGGGADLLSVGAGVGVGGRVYDMGQGEGGSKVELVNGVRERSKKGTRPGRG